MMMSGVHSDVDEFIEFFRELEKEDANEGKKATSSNGNLKAVRFFEQKNGEYYTVYGDSAVWIAQQFFTSTAVLREIGKEKLPRVNLRYLKLITLIRHILTERKDSVEVWTQPGKKGPKNWELSGSATPGRVTELQEWLATKHGSELDLENDSNGSSLVMAVRLEMKQGGQQCVLGIAFADVQHRLLEICEFSDDEVFGTLEALLIQKPVAECILSTAGAASSGELERLDGVFARCDVPVTKAVGTSEFSFKLETVEQDLARLAGQASSLVQDFDLKRAMLSLACLISYLNLLADDDNHGQYKVAIVDQTRFMRLNTAAIEALNLFPSPGDGPKEATHCLFGLLDHCGTSMGSRLLRRWISQPLMDVAEIRQRQSFVAAFIGDTHMRHTVRDEHLRRIPDLGKIKRKLDRGKAKLVDLVGLYGFASRLPALYDAFKVFSGDNEAATELIAEKIGRPLIALAEDMAPYSRMIEQVVDLKALERHEYLINPGFNEDLTALATRKEELMEGMEDICEETLSKLGLKDGKVKLLHKSGLGYHLKVSRKDEKTLRTKSFRVLETRKDGVRFTNRALQPLSDEWETTVKEYDSVQKEIVDKAIGITQSYVPVIEKAAELLGFVDVLMSFAHVSVCAPTPYCRPDILPKGSGILSMTNNRHPCLEVQDHVSFIPNNVQMVAGESALQIITGPNMGGKSTYIRQVGVTVLMAQLGCFVPCESAKIGVVDCILARVGAGDSQLKGVSTFMKEMLEASSILKTCTKNSLLIVDELGRGTSTYDGFGLAWAIAQYIADKVGCFSMFATHFHELTALADYSPNVVNKHVTAHTTANSITMLYHVLDGPCDRSFGVHVAEMAQFPATVVAAARKKAQELEGFCFTADKVVTKELINQVVNPSMATGEVSPVGTGSKRPREQSETPLERKVRVRLEEFHNMPLESMSQEEQAAKLASFKEELRSDQDLMNFLSSK